MALDRVTAVLVIALVAVVEVLSDVQRRKWDASDDVLFYAEPRFV